MKAVGPALLAAMLIGCSATPTSPTTSSHSIAAPSSQDAKPDPSERTMKVTLHFFYPLGGQRVEGMPVTVTGVPDGPSAVPLVTSKQGSVNIEVPRSTERIAWEVFANAGGFCPASGALVLPYGVKGNFFAIDIRLDCVSAP